MPRPTGLLVDGGGSLLLSELDSLSTDAGATGALSFGCFVFDVAEVQF
eukprot:XP_001705317.1 Hypothetical protein GL50803_27751 [Giardia lamblia ATCC 50803]